MVGGVLGRISLVVAFKMCGEGDALEDVTLVLRGVCTTPTYFVFSQPYADQDQTPLFEASVRRYPVLYVGISKDSHTTWIQ